MKNTERYYLHPWEPTIYNDADWPVLTFPTRDKAIARFEEIDPDFRVPVPARFPGYMLAPHNPHLEVPYVEVRRETAYGGTFDLPNAIRVF